MLISGFVLMGECFVPWFPFLLWILGVCAGCVLPVLPTCSADVLTGNTCCSWRLGISSRCDHWERQVEASILFLFLGQD